MDYGDKQMLNRSKKLHNHELIAFLQNSLLRTGSWKHLAAASAILILLLQPACLFKKGKSKPAVPTTSSMRMVLLPFNLPAGGEDLRWAVLAAPIMMAKISLRSKDIEVVPIWETMPTAIEAAGVSRSITPESATSVGTWLTAKWAIMGEISPDKKGVSIIVDFIPAKSSLVAFRYFQKGKIDAAGYGFNQAYQQFLHYSMAAPLAEGEGKHQGLTSLKDLAEALDREYGWFVNAEPGKAQQIVSDLARSDDRLARLLFNPALYPAIAQTQGK